MHYGPLFPARAKEKGDHIIKTWAQLITYWPARSMCVSSLEEIRDAHRPSMVKAQGYASCMRPCYGPLFPARTKSGDRNMHACLTKLEVDG